MPGRSCLVALWCYLAFLTLYCALRSDLGTHIDGFVATAAHTLVVQEDASAPVTGRAADVIQAAATGLEVAMRLIRPGKSISEVAGPLQKVQLTQIVYRLFTGRVLQYPLPYTLYYLAFVASITETCVEQW